jgi:hypothetical protein
MGMYNKAVIVERRVTGAQDSQSNVFAVGACATPSELAGLMWGKQ